MLFATCLTLTEWPKFPLRLSNSNRLTCCYVLIHYRDIPWTKYYVTHMFRILRCVTGKEGHHSSSDSNDLDAANIPSSSNSLFHCICVTTTKGSLRTEVSDANLPSPLVPIWRCIVRSKWKHVMPIVPPFVVLYVDEFKQGNRWLLTTIFIHILSPILSSSLSSSHN